MPATPPRFDVDPALPFKYVGGDPAIDLVNTVDWTDDGLVDERLVTYDGLTRWAEGAGVLAAADARALRRRAAAHPRLARAALDGAVALRVLLHDVFGELAAGELSAPTLAAFNGALADAAARLRVTPSGGGALALGWEGAGSALDAPRWAVAWSAARLVTSDERARIRVCGGPRCGWMFVDRSRNGLRHWCQTDVCGARAKARRHYARVRASRGG